MKGIVFDGEELRVVEGLELRDPGPGEVIVRIANSGVCHSDVSVIDGTIPFPTPVVLGHEGAGIVEEVGSGSPRWRRATSWSSIGGPCAVGVVPARGAGPGTASPPTTPPPG